VSKTTEEKPGTLVKDPAIVALSKIDAMLGGLTEAQRQQVLTWIVNKYAKETHDAGTE
jgi:hypothetical protein